LPETNKALIGYSDATTTVHGNTVSLAIWDHTVLLAIRHKYL